MPARLMFLFAALLFVTACGTPRPPSTVPAKPPAATPIPSGITPLTAEQDAQIGG